MKMENFKKAKLYDASGNLNDRWFVYYYFLNPETSKFQRFREWIPQKIHTAGGRRDKGHEMIKAINQKLFEGFNPFASHEKKYTLLKDALNFILDIKSQTCRIRTFHTYRYLTVGLLKWMKLKKVENMTVEQFKFVHAQEYMDYSKKDLKLSNTTCNYRRQYLKSLFEALIEREYVTVNPFNKVKKLPQEEAEIISFSPKELSIMQRHLPNYDYNLYVCACLVFYCFIRPQEIVRLKVNHFRLSSHSIIIPGTVSKNKKHEVVQIPNALMPVLQRFNLNFPDDYFVFSRNLDRGDKEVAPTRIAEKWREFADIVGLKKKIYALKNTGVGMAIENGINLRDLQLQLRHYSLEMTQIYLDKFKRRPSEKLARDFPDLSAIGNHHEPESPLKSSDIYTPIYS
jgi:integrase